MCRKAKTLSPLSLISLSHLSALTGPPYTPAPPAARRPGGGRPDGEGGGGPLISGAHRDCFSRTGHPSLLPPHTSACVDDGSMEGRFHPAVHL